MASYWRKTASAPSLEDLSHNTVISNLGKLAGSVKCNFSCGGALSQLSSVVLDYKKPSGEWSSEPVQLPLGLANEESMQTFLASCSITLALDVKWLLTRVIATLLSLSRKASLLILS